MFFYIVVTNYLLARQRIVKLVHMFSFLKWLKTRKEIMTAGVWKGKREPSFVGVEIKHRKYMYIWKETSQDLKCQANK